MLSQINTKILTILIFVVFIFFIQVISNHGKSTVTVEYETSTVRSSYGDEFWNYSGTASGIYGEGIVQDNIKEIIVEGFDTSISEKIKITHAQCPVKEGEKTSITNCIHYPNKIIGAPDNEPVDDGFLISVSCDDCINIVQKSFNRGGDYNIIYDVDNYYLTKNDVKKQILVPCSRGNISQITELIGTTG